MIAITPSTASVLAALRPCGRRNALTPFAIASTPVSAVEPDENARRTTKSVTAPAPVATGCGVTACGAVPKIVLARPTATRTNIAVMKAYVGRAKAIPDSRTPRRLTNTMTARQASDSATLCGSSDGAIDTTAKIPAAIETATVNT